MAIVVGTSSWADPGFVEEWYPEGLPARERLGYYAERFDAVEVNSTFYAVPSESSVSRWVEQTPDGFTFDVKLHKLLSRHSAPKNSLPKDLRRRVKTTPKGRVVLTERLQERLAERVLEAVQPLVDTGRLASFLLQLSPGFAPRSNRLDELAPLIEQLAPHPVAIELRRRSWVKGERAQQTLEWMEANGAAWVCNDSPPGEHLTIMLPLDAVTHPKLAYLRAHGRNTEGYVRGRTVAERFAWRYSDDELEEIRGRGQELAEQAAELRLMFNNNRGSDAPVAAERMRELLGQAISPGSSRNTGDEQLLQG
jgi:uncharacterized protein YecE (DUF72 family)